MGLFMVGGNHQGARKVGEELLRLAQREQDPIYLTEAHLTLGGALFCLAEFVPASELMEQGADLYDPQQHHAHTALFAADLGVFALPGHLIPCGISAIRSGVWLGAVRRSIWLKSWPIPILWWWH